MHRLHVSLCLRRVVKLVRALRKGWIKRDKAPEAPTSYLLWADDGLAEVRAPWRHLESVLPHVPACSLVCGFSLTFRHVTRFSESTVC